MQACSKTLQVVHVFRAHLANSKMLQVDMGVVKIVGAEIFKMLLVKRNALLVQLPLAVLEKFSLVARLVAA
jgi:hypothetical protein